MRQAFGTRTSPRPVSSNQYSWTSETLAGFAKAYSIHSVVPFVGHQSKYDEASFDALGSSPSFTPRGFLRPEVVTVLVVAMVGYGVGRALASVRGSQTSISPRPRLAHVEYGIATRFCPVFTMLPCASIASPYACDDLTTSTPFSSPGRYSADRIAVSGKTRLRTRPFALSTHSAVYTIG